MGIVTCSCGLCCSKDYLCNNCVIATLKANGLPLTFAEELSVLKTKSNSHSGFYKSEFSELSIKLTKLVEEHYGKYNQ